MSILVHLDNLKESAIYKLKYNGKIVGLRVKYYSLDDGKFYYYDFEVNYIKNEHLRNIVNKHSKSFKVLDMIDYNNLVCTQDEIDGTIVVQEFKDVASAETVLDKVIKILSEKGWGEIDV